MMWNVLIDRKGVNRIQTELLLRFAQQLKLREIAQITGLPLRTVQSRLRAALKALKMQLEKEDWR